MVDRFAIRRTLANRSAQAATISTARWVTVMPAAKGSIPWNSGTGSGWVDDRGYRWLYVTENGKRVARREHRVIIERHLGRKLEPWEIVHHKDGDTGNNALDNLEVQEFGAHTAAHHKGTRKTWEARRSMEAFALMREELRRCREINSDLLEAARDAADLLSNIRESTPADIIDACVAKLRTALSKSCTPDGDGVTR